MVSALLPLLGALWSGYIEAYQRIPNADVRVDGVPAGYAHRGPKTTIITRTDIVGRHSYRIWPANGVNVFDCHHWVAPEWRLFFQGKVSEPCIFPTSTASMGPAAPVSSWIVKGDIRSFRTRDGKTISYRMTR
jgi:hypothetical protein